MNNGDKIQFLGIRNLDLLDRYLDERYENWLEWVNEDKLIIGQFYKFDRYSDTDNNTFVRLCSPNDRYEYPIYFFKTPKEKFYEEVLDD